MAALTLKELPAAMMVVAAQRFALMSESDTKKRQRGNKNARGVPLTPGDEVLARTREGLVTARILDWRYDADWKGWGGYYYAFFLDDLQRHYVKETSIVWWPGKPERKPKK